ncbi:MAG TPA: DUF4389 domain-containing protein [Dehalococcoidia bacterium]|nr:DUF4389 domain-containing protein [Dehalococcoidia bacterium]
MQVLLALVALWFGSIFGWLLYVGLPIVAALGVSSKGSQRWLQEDSGKITGWLRQYLGLYAYGFFLTTQLSTENMGQNVRLEITPDANPNVGSALLRWIMTIPSYFVFSLFGIVSGIFWLISAVSILISGTYPESFVSFQRGMLAWQAKLFGYHASLTDVYPPFSVETDTGTATA